MNRMIKERTCPICGKIFYPPQENIYKVYVKSGKTGYKKVDVCSYHCWKNGGGDKIKKWDY
jgi:hypothetical protein